MFERCAASDMQPSFCDEGGVKYGPWKVRRRAEYEDWTAELHKSICLAGKAGKAGEGKAEEEDLKVYVQLESS